MNKTYRYLRAGIAVLVGTLSVLAFAGTFYRVKIFDIQFSALLQRFFIDFSVAATVLLALLLLLTFIFGRIYCSALCPFGLYQELLMLLFHRKNQSQKNYPYKYFLAALLFGTLIGGTAFLLRLIDPYTIFGSAASITCLGLSLAAAIAILVWFKGRFFCTNICPIGTVLGLISKHALTRISINADACVSCGLCASKCPTGSIDFKNKTVDNETCIKCFNCLAACRKNGIAVNRPAKAETKTPFSPSRRKLLLSGAVVAAFALAAKGGIELSKSIAKKIKKAILPAGAGNPEDFANRCLNCNLCVQNCPMKILKKANEDYPAVHIDYSDSFCDYNCHKCSEVCPSGAIKRLTLPEKQKTQIALAVIDESTCVKCGLCVMKCPRQAITKANGEFPHINTDECIGCGACKNACPVKAISISALDRQRTL